MRLKRQTDIHNLQNKNNCKILWKQLNIESEKMGHTIMVLKTEKTNNVVFEQVRHKLGCTATEDN